MPVGPAVADPISAPAPAPIPIPSAMLRSRSGVAAQPDNRIAADVTAKNARISLGPPRNVRPPSSPITIGLAVFVSSNAIGCCTGNYTMVRPPKVRSLSRCDIAGVRDGNPGTASPCDSPPFSLRLRFDHRVDLSRNKDLRSCCTQLQCTCSPVPSPERCSRSEPCRFCPAPSLLRPSFWLWFKAILRASQPLQSSSLLRLDILLEFTAAPFSRGPAMPPKPLHAVAGATLIAEVWFSDQKFRREFIWPPGASAKSNRRFHMRWRAVSVTRIIFRRRIGCLVKDDADDG